MRAFLIIAATFIAAAIGVTLIAPDKATALETWIIVGVTIILLAAWSFIGRKKK